MVFVESKLFTKLLPDFLDDDEYRLFQQTLLMRPEIGDLIQGKRGGIRMIYYFLSSHLRFYMLTIYAKGQVTNLKADEKKALARLMQEWKNEQET
jgi:mRNA-degrading endonuclease RelE of RelBE toxin-antitoxin system